MSDTVQLGRSSYGSYYNQDGFDEDAQSGLSARENISVSDTFAGVKNPRWKQQIRNGQDATTVASGTKYRLGGNGFFSATIDYQFGAFGSWPGGRGHTRRFLADGYMGLPVSPFQAVPDDVFDSVNNRAISSFIDDCQSHQSSFESGQDIGEIRETIHSLIHPMSALREHVLSYFDILQRKRIGKGRRILPYKALTSTYLEWTFGWKPLAQDVADAISKLGRIHPQIERAKGKSTQRFEYFTGSVDLGAGPGLSAWMPMRALTDATYSGSFSVRFKGAVRSKANPDGRVPLVQDLQLDLPHWLPTAWDLLPYSWIVDYFLNIGDIVKAYSFNSSDLIWAVKTSRTFWNVECKNTRWHPDDVKALSLLDRVSINNVSIEGGVFQLSRADFLRSPVSGSDLIPSLRFSLPTNSIKPWLNMGALIADRAAGFTGVKII